MNILKFFKRTKKSDNNKKRLRAPHKLFTGVIVPRWLLKEKLRESGKSAPKTLPSKVRFNHRFQARELSDGNYIVCRTGSPIPKVGTFLLPGFRFYTASVTTI